MSDEPMPFLERRHIDPSIFSQGWRATWDPALCVTCGEDREHCTGSFNDVRQYDTPSEATELTAAFRTVVSALEHALLVGAVTREDVAALEVIRPVVIEALRQKDGQ